jgi:hypothetical protein
MANYIRDSAMVNLDCYLLWIFFHPLALAYGSVFTFPASIYQLVI